MKIEFSPIGIIHTPFEERRGRPIRPAAGVGVEGRVEVFEEFQEGLQDLGRHAPAGHQAPRD